MVSIDLFSSLNKTLCFITLWWDLWNNFWKTSAQFIKIIDLHCLWGSLRKSSNAPLPFCSFLPVLWLIEIQACFSARAVTQLLTPALCLSSWQLSRETNPHAPLTCKSQDWCVVSPSTRTSRALSMYFFPTFLFHCSSQTNPAILGYTTETNKTWPSDTWGIGSWASLAGSEAQLCHSLVVWP